MNKEEIESLVQETADKLCEIAGEGRELWDALFEELETREDVGEIAGFFREWLEDNADTNKENKE